MRETALSPRVERSPLVLSIPDFVEFIRRRWKLIAGSAAVSTLAVLIYVLQATPIYSAKTQILLEVPTENVFGNDRIIAQRTLGTEIVDSQLVVLRSSSLLRQVVQAHNLVQDPEFQPPEPSWTSRLVSWIMDAEHEQPVASTATAVDALEEVVAVSRVGNSNVIEVTASSSSADKAALLANAVADAYVADQIEARHEGARRASIWLNERMALQRNQLEASESAVEKFRAEHNLHVTREGSISEQQLSELNLSLISAQAELAEKRARYLQVEQLQRKGDDLQGFPDVLKSTAVAELRTKRAELERSEADLLSKYGERHPDVARVRNELQEMDKQIQAEIGRVVVNLRNELEVAESRTKTLELAVEGASGRSGSESQQSVTLRELERIAASDRELYESFLARARLAQEEASISIAEARIISPAHVPERPTFPRKKFSVLLGLLFGVGVGVCGAAVMEASRRYFLAEREVEESLRLPVLASVPRLDHWKGNNERVVDDLAGLQSWRYNAAIESIGIGADTMASAEAPDGPVQVTSALPGEGKTTLAISLAVAAASTGHRVLLIDGDLRRSDTTKAFGLSDAVGLVDVIGFSAAPLASIHHDERTGVHVIPAGAKTKLQATLLGSPRMRSLFPYLRAMFDVIIIDSPPVAVAIDAEIISSYASKVIFGVRWNHTGRDAIERAIKRLKAAPGSVNLVLTMVNEQQLPRYGPYASLESDAINTYYKP